jgi:enamine deaminase RidA (YjgF/YER057c/UK114 family)
MPDLEQETQMMARTPINPWHWQDARGFTQAWRVDGPATTVHLSGQVSVDEDGLLVGADDFELQTRRCFDNLAAVLAQAGATLADVVKLTVYLTDISRLPEYGRVKAGYIHGQQPASTAVEVAALAMPGLMIEVEATAAL